MNVARINAIYNVVFQRAPHHGEVPLAFGFVGEEKNLEPQLAQASKETRESCQNGAGALGQHDEAGQ